MPVLEGKKYACAACIKGHRSSSCKHSIKRKGRPTSQCPKCRELRKSKGIHSRCACEDRVEDVVARPTGPNSKALLALQRGLAEGAVVVQSEGSPAASSSTGSCCSSKRKASSPPPGSEDIKPVLPPFCADDFAPYFAPVASTSAAPFALPSSHPDDWFAGQLITHDSLRASQHCASNAQPSSITSSSSCSHPHDMLSSLALGLSPATLDFEVGDIWMPQSLLPAPPPSLAPQSGLTTCTHCGPSCSCGVNCSCGTVAALEQSLRRSGQEGGDDMWQKLMDDLDEANANANVPTTSTACHSTKDSTTTTMHSCHHSTTMPTLSDPLLNSVLAGSTTQSLTVDDAIGLNSTLVGPASPTTLYIPTTV